jgi:hypothetical protein
VNEKANPSVATEGTILLSSERQKNEALEAQNEALAVQVWTRSLPSMSTAPRTRLLTTFGTLVYLDSDSGELRHGAIASSPENVVLVADPGGADAGRHGWLVHAVSDAFEPIACRADGCQTISRAETKNGERPVPPTLLEVVPLDRGLIALKGGTAFLCAEPPGAITLSRTRCSVWECFAPSQDWWTTAVASEAHNTGSMVDPSIDWPAIRSFAPANRKPQQGTAPVATSNIGENEGPFAHRRVLVIGHRGNLANKMLQYMGALTLARRIKDCAIVNVSIPEWGIEIPDDTQHQQFFDNLDLWTWDAFRPHVQEICTIANKSPSIRIMMADHLQRMEFLGSPEFYNGIFPKNSHLYHKVTDNELLINIRAGEILGGVPHYPLVPIAFYEEVVEKTGLSPMFIGQLESSEYVAELKRRFPGARFINSHGARADFDLIRSAKNIIVAVSTFSWLAAWLSEADNIFLPLTGFYNPAHHREVDLLPVDDVRYRFFLFPLNFGLPENESLQHHERMKSYWKEISRNQVALLKTSSPFLRTPRENYDSGLPRRSAPGSALTFDPVWYAHTYIDAAMEISEGWFEDPLHHYLEVGRLRGYLPTCPIQNDGLLDLSLPNLAINKPATQSSLSQWSKGATVEEDAGYAVNGNPQGDGFHTDNESNPWWMVDLGNTAQVHLIRIFNRERIPDWMQQRAAPLIAEVSTDRVQWTTLFHTDPKQLFGGYSGGRPLVWSSSQPVEARFVRISIPRREYLHLAEVEIYGAPITRRAEIAETVGKR